MRIDTEEATPTIRVLDAEEIGAAAGGNVLTDTIGKLMQVTESLVHCTAWAVGAFGRQCTTRDL